MAGKSWGIWKLDTFGARKTCQREKIVSVPSVKVLKSPSMFTPDETPFPAPRVKLTMSP